MTNKNVIEIIDRLMDPDADKLAYNATEVFSAIVHGYYYIRPGKNTHRFLKRINKIFIEGRKAANQKHAETKEGVPFDMWFFGKMSADMLMIAREMFDEEYYASQISRMVMHEKYDDSLLERYMYWLDGEELKSIFEGIVTFKNRLDIFISDNNFDSMTSELDERSIDVIHNSPEYMKDYDKHIVCIDNDWDSCFKYLRRESIVEIICRYIDEDKLMLASMVKAFKYSDARTAAEYTGIAYLMMYEFEQDIFDPVITDMRRIHLNTHNSNSSDVIYSNKSGKIMLV